MGWTCGTNGKGTFNEENRCARSGEYMEKRKTATEMRGLREERFGGSGK